MKSILSIASAILFLACLTSCMTMYNNPDYEPKILDIDENSTVVCFGDSLTNGHGADRDTESWPAVLQEKSKFRLLILVKMMIQLTTESSVSRLMF